MTRVLIADDHAIVRKGLRQVAKEQAPHLEIGEAADGDEVLHLIQAEHWDALVLDISMPKRSGLDILQEVRHLRPQMPVLMLSVYSEDQYAIRVLKAGAAGYMSKDCAPDELMQAIERVVSGGRYVSETLAEKLAFELGGGGTRPIHERLSDREYTVLLLIGAGKSVGEIADDLVLSVKTVSTYRSRVLEKLNLKTNADLIRYVIEHQLA